MNEEAWSRFLEHAARARTKPTFEHEERRPRLRAAARLADALDTARAGGDGSELLV